MNDDKVNDNQSDKVNDPQSDKVDDHQSDKDKKITTMNDNSNNDDDIIYVEISETDITMPIKLIKEYKKSTKLYLGGYHHKLKNIDYHHAFTQTAIKNVTLIHRETQTIENITRSQQTTKDNGTQMARKDLIIDNSNDYYLIAKPYFTASQLEQVRQTNATKIHQFFKTMFCFSYYK